MHEWVSKIFIVITTCKTVEQLNGAYKLIKNFESKYPFKQSIVDEMVEWYGWKKEAIKGI